MKANVSMFTSKNVSEDPFLSVRSVPVFSRRNLP